MAYPPEEVEKFRVEYATLLERLQWLAFECIRHGQHITEPHVQEHMLRGAGRRIEVIRSAIKNVFTDFPPETINKLPRETLSDVQINLQAFVINLYGVFDNFAWAFVLRHDLERHIGSRHQIGMFNRETQRFLPVPIRDYLTKPETIKWFEDYLKEYRDSLAHRIPLYVPPFVVTGDEGNLFNALEAEKLSCIGDGNWKRLDEIYAEQEAIGSPCFAFVNAFSGPEPPKPIDMHSQLLYDAKKLLEFGVLFLENWHDQVT